MLLTGRQTSPFTRPYVPLLKMVMVPSDHESALDSLKFCYDSPHVHPECQGAAWARSKVNVLL